MKATMSTPLVIKRWHAAIVMAVLAALFVAACGNKFQQQFQDAPRTPQTNSAPAEVILMPDGFNNLATKCDNGSRIYVSYHGDGNYGFGFAVPNAPGC
jgi:hypothetical protein